MKTIHKYSVDLDDEFERHLPRGAKILSVHGRGLSASMWALVDEPVPGPRGLTGDVTEVRTFRTIGTGHPIDDASQLSFIGTFLLDDGDVYHLFEKKTGSSIKLV